MPIKFVEPSAEELAERGVVVEVTAPEQEPEPEPAPEPAPEQDESDEAAKMAREAEEMDFQEGGGEPRAPE